MLANGHWFKWHFYPPPFHKYGVVGEVGSLNPLRCMGIYLVPKKNVEYAGEISFSFYCLLVWAYQCKRLTLLVMEVRPLIRDAFIYYSIKLRNFLCASYDNPIRMNIRPFGSCGWLVTKLIYSATCLQYWCRLFNLWGTISC